MPIIDFPSTPSDDDIYSVNGKSWRYSSSSSSWNNITPGFAGSQGGTGFTGSIGFSGSLGFTGSVGFVGSRGFTGSAGAGFTGSQGLVGSQGFTGSTGFTGSKGDSSSITVSNDTTTNSNFYISITSQTSGNLSSVKVLSSKLFYNPLSGQLNATEFNSASDINLKENITKIENVFPIINSINGVQFNWKENSIKSYGFIAQEVEKVLPELVKDGAYKSINYTAIIAFLLEAVKELKKDVENLKGIK